MAASGASLLESFSLSPEKTEKKPGKNYESGTANSLTAISSDHKAIALDRAAATDVVREVAVWIFSLAFD